jgi:hypothetical protein
LYLTALRKKNWQAKNISDAKKILRCENNGGFFLHFSGVGRAANGQESDN